MTSPPIFRDRAPAKVNLSLRVIGRRADGYHELDSVVVFAGVGDALTFTPGREWSLSVDGPTASAAGEAADNLVLRAVHALADRVPDVPRGHFHLVKRLPVAAGIGGGSSDAAAALRLVARAGGPVVRQPAILDAARATGADVTVCLEPRARTMRGIGHDLGPVLGFPPLFAVLVNPCIAVPTPAVFRALGLQPGQELRPDLADRPSDPPVASAQALIAWLADNPNDIEPPALAVAPGIADALTALSGTPACRLARMSGSGATCFGLFDDCRTAARAARDLRAAHRDWWIVPTVLR